MTADDAAYVFGRIDMYHVGAVAKKVRQYWTLGDDELACEACYQPGDGTHYGLLFVAVDSRLPLFGAEGGGTGGHGPTHAWGGMLDEPPDRMLAYWIQQSRGIQFGDGEFIHPARLSEYGTTEASSLALAALLNLVSGYGAGWRRRYVENLREAEGVAS